MNIISKPIKCLNETYYILTEVKQYRTIKLSELQNNISVTQTVAYTETSQYATGTTFDSINIVFDSFIFIYCTEKTFHFICFIPILYLKNVFLNAEKCNNILTTMETISIALQQWFREH